MPWHSFSITAYVCLIICGKSQLSVRNVLLETITGRWLSKNEAGGEEKTVRVKVRQIYI
jgi:hypothetical protein